MSKRIPHLLVGSSVTVAALLVLLVAGSLVARPFASRIAEREFPPPGRVLEVGGRSAHIHCTGSGSPTILLESGLDTRGSSAWAGIRDELSQISRVCAYDRAGILWSEPGDGPRDAGRIAAELSAVLGAASEAPPYVMVGHSLGGLLVRVYDQRFPGQVAGFVFVDASHPEQAGSAGPLGDRPVVVLTAGTPVTIPGVSDQGIAAMRQTWLELQRELAHLSSNSDHRVVAGAGHYVQVDRPDAVVSAIGDVVAAVRGGGTVRRGSGGPGAL